jgi:hypothetical protein
MIVTEGVDIARMYPNTGFCRKITPSRNVTFSV